MLPHPDRHILRTAAPGPRVAYRRRLDRALRRRAYELGMGDTGFFPLRWAMRVGTVAFGLALVVSTGIAYGSPAVTRQSPLFVVKRVGESIQVAASRSPEGLVELHLRIAARRLAEAERLADRGIVDIPTIAEARANTEQAVAVAHSVTTPKARTQARTNIARASRSHVETLTSMSVRAQVGANRPTIVLERDALAMAPSRTSVPPSPVPPAGDPGDIPASAPHDGAVAGAVLALAPALTPPAQVRFTAPDPAIAILNEAIASSTANADRQDEELRKDQESSLVPTEPSVKLAPVEEPASLD